MFRCHFCDGRSYYQLNDVEIDARVGQAMKRAETLGGRVVVCAGCGWLEFFVEDPADWAKRAGATLWVPESEGTYR